MTYRSRSFHEGKKIAFVRDPLTWIRACFKYRFVRLYPRTEIPRARRSGLIAPIRWAGR